MLRMLNWKSLSGGDDPLGNPLPRVGDPWGPPPPGGGPPGEAPAPGRGDRKFDEGSMKCSKCASSNCTT